jgi:DNA-nicking Smr family endonuclease
MMKLDLHGTKHEDVKRKLDVFFWECMQKKITQVEVITGMSDKMKEIVIDTANEYKFRVNDFNINPGSLFINI